MADLWFFYEDMMRAEKQQAIGLDAELLSLATVRGKLYRYWEERGKYRHFLIPGNTGLVVGGLFLCYNAEERRYPLHAVFNAGSILTGEITNKDFYQPAELLATPIWIDSFETILLREEKRGDPVRVSSFVGNPENRHLKEAMRKKGKNRKQSGMDLVNLLALMKEQT